MSTCRKERIARRMEGIEGEVHANRLLEEDTPRYTRASDPCGGERSSAAAQTCHSVLCVKLTSPCLLVTVQRCGTEGSEGPDMQLGAAERQSRAQTEPVYGSGTGAPELESKAERIARYKAERRRQLAERYGISLDPEPGSRYARKESDSSERRGGSVGEEGRDVTMDSKARAGHPDPGYETGRTRVDSFSEREKLMNLENQRRASASSSSYMDVASFSTAAAAPAKDCSVAGMPPTSPRLSRHPSLSSPKHGVSPGDLFIEQQAHNILSRQG